MPKDDKRRTGRTTRQLENILNMIYLGKNSLYFCATLQQAKCVATMFQQMLKDRNVNFERRLLTFQIGDRQITFDGVDNINEFTYRGRTLKNYYLDVDHNCPFNNNINLVFEAMRRGGSNG